MVKEVATKTSDIAGDGTTTATVLAAGHLPRGPQERHRRLEPDGHQARHRPGRERGRRGAQEDQRSDDRQERDRPGGRHLREQRPGDRRPDRRRVRQGRQGRRHHRRRGQGPRDDARDGRGHAVRPRLRLAVLRHRSGEDGSRPRGRAHPDPRQEGLVDEGPAPGAGEGRAAGTSAAHHRRGHRRRGAWRRWSSTSSAARSRSAP